MDESRRVTACVGIGVSKDRLDVHVLPSGEAFAVARDGKGLDSLVGRLGALDVSLIVLEATGGFETTVCREPSWLGLINSWCKGGWVGAPDDPLARWRLEMICGSKES